LRPAPPTANRSLEYVQGIYVQGILRHPPGKPRTRGRKSAGTCPFSAMRAGCTWSGKGHNMGKLFLPIRGWASIGLMTSVLMMSATGARAQQESTIIDKLKAAENFAAKLALPDAPQFEEYRRKAIEMAIRPSPAVRGLSARSIPARPHPPSVAFDGRFQSNAVQMARQTVSGARPRIFGGTIVIAANYPDAASVQGAGGYCTGTLISPNVVLTAAHCACTAVNERVVFGIDIEKPDQTIKVTRSVAMNACGNNLGGSDVALLFLERPPESIAPRALAGSSLLAKIVDLTAVGFGLTESGASGKKLVVNLPVASAACTETFDGQADASYYGCTAGAELVAGMQNLKKDTCHGDSGGPLYLKTNNGDLLVATTSRGVESSGTTDCGDGGIYELLQGHILDWIQSTVAVAVNVVN
jgi:Trypsin